jgi:phenylalanine ammonia-lyase
MDRTREKDHVQICLSLFDDYKQLQPTVDLVLDGTSLTVASAAAIAARNFRQIVTSPEVATRLHDNSAFLDEVLTSGHVVYGITTGYGGSADVRSSNAHLMQQAFIRHLNVGFADTIKPETMRVIMAVRANSLSRGYSGVGPEVVELLCKMLNADLIPLAPLRGYV